MARPARCRRCWARHAQKAVIAAGHAAERIGEKVEKLREGQRQHDEIDPCRRIEIQPAPASPWLRPEPPRPRAPAGPEWPSGSGRSPPHKPRPQPTRTPTRWKKMLMRYKLSADYSEAQIALLEREAAAAEKAAEAYRKKWNVDKDGFSTNSSGQREQQWVRDPRDHHRVPGAGGARQDAVGGLGQQFVQPNGTANYEATGAAWRRQNSTLEALGKMTDYYTWGRQARSATTYRRSERRSAAQGALRINGGRANCGRRDHDFTIDGVREQVCVQDDASATALQTCGARSLRGGQPWPVK